MDFTTNMNTQAQTGATSRPNPKVKLNPEEVRVRAYGLYLASGCPQNCADQHWYQAEQEILAEKRRKNR